MGNNRYVFAFGYIAPGLCRTPLNSGLAVAVRLPLPENTIQGYKHHGGSV